MGQVEVGSGQTLVALQTDYLGQTTGIWQDWEEKDPYPYVKYQSSLAGIGHTIPSRYDASMV